MCSIQLGVRGDHHRPGVQLEARTREARPPREGGARRPRAEALPDAQPQSHGHAQRHGDDRLARPNPFLLLVLLHLGGSPLLFLLVPDALPLPARGRRRRQQQHDA